MKNSKRILAILGVTALMATSFTGCQSSNTSSKNPENEKITYWVSLNPNTANSVSNLGETPLSKKMSEETGVQVEYLHPPRGQETEKFNIMVASESLPDIIEYIWGNFPGGPEKAIKDKIIVSVDDYKDSAKNFYAYLNANADIAKQAKTDSGVVFGFPFIRGDKTLLTSTGIILRKDWLDELKLGVPETIADFEKVLIAFKDKKGATAPISMDVSAFSWGAFTGTFNTKSGYYQDNGKIKYGAYEPQFKEFLVLMNKWYKEKLLDQNFATLDTKIRESNMLTGVAGATFGPVGGNMGKWLSAMGGKGGFDLVAAPYPVLEKGTTPEFGQTQMPVTNSYSAVTKDSKNAALAVKFLDYGYSEKGRMLYNFGIENESYNMVDGYPKYTDLITKNPKGLSMAESLALYTRSFDVGPFVQDKRYMEQYAALPQQKQALKTWMNTNDLNHQLPALYVDEKELSESAKLGNAVDTYAKEMMSKFIMGVEPMSNFDAFREQLKARGVERLIEMKQAAYQRYLNR